MVVKSHQKKLEFDFVILFRVVHKECLEELTKKRKEIFQEDLDKKTRQVAELTLLNKEQKLMLKTMQ